MRALHASGEWDQPDSRVRTTADAWAELDLDFLSHTEARLHLDALKTITTMRLCHGKGDDGQTECALQVRNDRWRVIETKTVRLSHLVIPRRKARCYALHVHVEDRATGQRHHRIIIHMPSGVDGVFGIKHNAQGRVYRSALAGLAAYVDELDGPVIITGDWNLHLLKRWVRALLAEHFPDFEHTPLTAKGGTHGARFIDFSLARGVALDAPRIMPNPASDHRGLAERQEITMSNTPKTDAWIAAMRRRGVEVLTHDQWGSQRTGVYAERLRTRPHSLLPGRPVDTLWNHITVTNDDGTLIGEFKADMREVERIGFERFGTGFSYNVGFDANPPHPRVGIGQFFEARGAHTINDKGIAGYSLNQNKVAIAFAWIGMPGDKINEHAREAMVQARAAAIEVGILTETYDDVPHSLVAPKDCPTDELRDMLPALKRDGLAAVNTRPTPPKPDPTPRRLSRVQRARALINRGTALLAEAARASRPGRRNSINRGVRKIREARDTDIPKK